MNILCTSKTISRKNKLIEHKMGFSLRRLYCKSGTGPSRLGPTPVQKGGTPAYLVNIPEQLDEYENSMCDVPYAL